MEIKDSLNQIEKEIIYDDFRDGETISIVEVRKDWHKVNITPKKSWDSFEVLIKQKLIEMGFSHQSFKTNKGSQEHHFKNVYGINIYVTKKRAKIKRIEIDFQGRFFIYKEAIEFSKKIITDIKKVFVNAGINTEIKSKRIDPAFLIMAPTIETVINTNLEEIINCSTLEPHHFYDKYGKLTAVYYKNSELILKVYNKSYQLEENSKDLTYEYIKYHEPFLEEAKNRNCILVRVELLIRAKTYLSYYDSVFKGPNHDENQAVMDLFDIFNDKHRFRVKGPEYGKKRQTQHLKEDPITKLFGNASNSLKIHRENVKEKDKIDFVYGMNNAESVISEKFITLARSVAKINPNINLTKLHDFYKAFEKEFSIYAPLVKTELKQLLFDQAKTRIYFSECEQEMDIIIDAFIDKSDKNDILCKNNLKSLREYKKRKLKELEK